jgi:hypothetical protein
VLSRRMLQALFLAGTTSAGTLAALQPHSRGGPFISLDRMRALSYRMSTANCRPPSRAMSRLAALSEPAQNARLLNATYRSLRWALVKLCAHGGRSGHQLRAPYMAASNEENDMTNYLSFHFDKTAEWRFRKAERHQEDWRNADAVERLNALSAQIGTSDAFSALQEMEADVDGPHYDGVADARSEVLASIGFGFLPETADEVAIAIVRRLKGYPSIDDAAGLTRERSA